MQTIALSTRQAKRGPEGEVWREDARARSAEHGFGPAELDAMLSQPAAGAQRPVYAKVVGRLSGPEGLTGNHNTFARRHAVAELAGEFSDGVSLRDLERAADGYLADPSVRALANRDDGTALFSTTSLLACERAIIDAAKRQRSQPAATVPAQLVDEVLAGTILNVDQATAVRRLASDGQAVQSVQALAGTGKTTLLRALADAYTRAGYRVIGTAPTARAARELRETAGVDAGTLHALAGQMDRAAQPLGDVLLLDEAGMAATRITARVFAHAERTGIKIIAVGDGGQLASVEAGGWFAALSRDLPGPDLREVIRQRDPAERAALAALHDGDAETYLEHKASAITIHASEPDALAAATERWATLRDEHGPSGVVMIARDNATRDQLNTAARARLLAEGQLSADQESIGDREWAVGDRVIARHNDRRLDIDNGTVGTVTALLPHGTGLEVTTDSGQARALNAAYVTEHLQHAYAITGHSSQGATVEAAIVVGRPEEFTREWAYTTLSRARGQTTLELITEQRADDAERSDYAPTPTPREPADALDGLGRAMHRSESERLATEQTQPGRVNQTAAPARSNPQTRPFLRPGWAARQSAARPHRPNAGHDQGIGR